MRDRAHGAVDDVRIYSGASSPLVLRARAEVEEFLGDFELADPALVQLPLWWPQGQLHQGSQEAAPAYAGAGVKR
ncbi:SAM-dependent methyltransferase [Kitasatospora sp. NBC_00039]|uniref:SAM-dependent methyltransferase n=1 Tax=Kitasatospora sp. NBC_00039 TaxID=2903565 RepID=UPI0038656074